MPNKETDSDPKLRDARGIVGQVFLWDTNLCRVDENGRFYLSAPRRADVALAHRLGATLREMEAERLTALPSAVRER